jgi:uncharacterized protein
MQTAIVCTALLGLLLFVLGLAVSMLRTKMGVLIGHPVSETDLLHRMVRAHGNTAEYAAMLGVLFLWHGAHSPPLWILIAIIATTVSRYLLVLGLLLGPTLSRANPLRFVGAVGTYVGGLTLTAAAPFVA